MILFNKELVMNLLSKHTLAVGAGSLAGVMLYVPVLNALGIPSAPGFGMDDLVIGLTFAATITAAMMVLR
jgi:hypothetical protein